MQRGDFVSPNIQKKTTHREIRFVCNLNIRQLTLVSLAKLSQVFAVFWTVLAAILIFLTLVVLAVFVFFYFSQKPLVNFLRNLGGEGESVIQPKNYEEYRSQVRLEKDLIYASNYPANRYDLYRPNNSTGDEPVIIWAHGGGFVAGRKEGTEHLCTMLSSLGYVVASMDYALAPEYKYPVAIEQVGELGRHLKEEGFNLERVFLGGDSAGAHIISLYAATETNQALAKAMDFQPVHKPETLRGVILCCGPFDLVAIGRVNLKLRFLTWVLARAYFGVPFWHRSKEVKRSNVVENVTAQYPPTYITDGNTGSFEVQGRRLGNKLRSLGVPVQELYFKPERGEIPHEYLFLLDTKEALEGFHDLAEFLKQHSA